MSDQEILLVMTICQLLKQPTYPDAVRKAYWDSQQQLKNENANQSQQENKQA
jgi:hypothetical protein